MRLSKVLTGFALVSAVGASALQATTIGKHFWNRCTPGSLRSCTSISVFTTPAGTGTLVNIFVRNEEGSTLKPWLGDNTGGSIIRKIGLVAPPNIGTNTASLAVTYTGGATKVGSPAPKWKLHSPGALGGPIELDAAVGTGQPIGSNYDGGIEGCNSPATQVPDRFRTCGVGWVVFTFTTTTSWNATQSDVAWITTGFAVGGQGVECDADPNAPASRVFCPAVVPEPVTMLLLGSGLAGVGGFGLMRRRKDNEIENG